MIDNPTTDTSVGTQVDTGIKTDRLVLDIWGSIVEIIKPKYKIWDLVYIMHDKNVYKQAIIESATYQYPEISKQWDPMVWMYTTEQWRWVIFTEDQIIWIVQRLKLWTNENLSANTELQRASLIDSKTI